MKPLHPFFRSITLTCALALVSPLTRAETAAAPPVPTTMKAVVARVYGGPDVVHYEDVPVPQPKEDEILVRVVAAGVNPVDALIVSGKYAKEFGTKLPVIPGYDVSGWVVRVGAKCTRLKVGDPVYAFTREAGTWAEYCALPESITALKPDEADFAASAVIPVAALTAWQALVDTAHLSAGQTVLIQGGSGGVGSFAVQIAKARGARVIATASTDHQLFLNRLGADVPIDYTKQKFEDVAKDVDVVLDTVGGETLARSYGVVKKGGFIVSIVGTPDAAELEKHQIRGSGLRARPDAAELTEINHLIDDGKMRAYISRTLQLPDAAEALALVATHHTLGKIVLVVPGPAKK